MPPSSSLRCLLPFAATSVLRVQQTKGKGEIAGLEKVKSFCKYSRTKILGTMVCLAGAVSMSLIRSPDVVRHSQRQSVMLNPLKKESYNDWVIGCSCLLGGVFFLSCSTVLQAATMIEFPAPFSLCVVTSLLGAILTSVLQIITEGKLGIGQPAISIQAIIAIVFLSRGYDRLARSC